MKRPRKRPPAHNPRPTPPLVQVMPGGRARIDPTCVRDLVCWTIALSKRWERTSQMTYRGHTGIVRDRRKGQIAYAKLMLEACAALAASLTETVDLDAFNRALEDWTSAVQPQPPV